MKYQHTPTKNPTVIELIRHFNSTHTAYRATYAPTNWRGWYEFVITRISEPKKAIGFFGTKPAFMVYLDPDVLQRVMEAEDIDVVDIND